MNHRTRTLAQMRVSDLKKIHVAKTQCNMSDEDYKKAISDISKGRTDSSAELTHVERAALLRHMERCGFKARKPKQNRRAPAKPDLPIGDDRDQVKMIRGLWIELHEFGAVRDASELAMCAYVKRVTRKDHPKFLDIEQASDVIEQLKKWRDRVRTAPFRAMLPNVNPKTSARTIYAIVRRELKLNILDCDVAQWQHAQTLFKDVVAQAANTGGQDG